MPLSISQAANLAGVSDHTMYRLCNALPLEIQFECRAGKQWKIPEWLLAVVKIALVADKTALMAQYSKLKAREQT